jgi:hypothetical protein
VAKLLLERIEELTLRNFRIQKRIEFIFKKINDNESSYFSYLNYKYASPMGNRETQVNFSKKLEPLFVIQGQISEGGDFEDASLRHYLNINPSQKILISTWDDKNANSLQKKYSHISNIDFLFNEEPFSSGPSNLNFQITNTRNGLDWAQKKGFEYALKIRTDQCMMHPRALENLSTHYLQYNNEEDSKILVNSLNTFLFRPYGASDMFQFGKTLDLLEYRKAPIDIRKPEDYNLFIEGASLRDIATRQFGETYLGSHYLKSKGIEPNYQLKQSIQFITKYFVVLDPPVTDLVWNKYTFNAKRWPNHNHCAPYQELDYSTWLALRTGLLDITHLDFLLDLPVVNREFIYG